MSSCHSLSSTSSYPGLPLSIAFAKAEPGAILSTPDQGVLLSMMVAIANAVDVDVVAVAMVQMELL